MLSVLVAVGEVIMHLSPHRTLTLEHNSREPLELEKEVVDPERSVEDLINFESSLLQDAHLGIVRCLLSHPTVSDE